jgi:hypothetical protein
MSTQRQHAITKRPFYGIIAYLIYLFLFGSHPSPASAHTASCALTGNTAEAIMAYNACKAENQAGIAHEESDSNQQDAEMQRLKHENQILHVQLDTIRMTLFQLLQKLTTQ